MTFSELRLKYVIVNVLRSIFMVSTALSSVKSALPGNQVLHLEDQLLVWIGAGHNASLDNLHMALQTRCGIQISIQVS